MSIILIILGLQMAYFLQDAGREYIVFEKNDIAGMMKDYR